MKFLLFGIKLILTVALSVILIYFWLLNRSYDPSASIVYLYSVPFMFFVFIIIAFVCWFFKRSWFLPLLLNSFFTPVIFLFIVNAKANAHYENNYKEFTVDTHHGEFRITFQLRQREMINDYEFYILKKEGNGNSGFDEGTYKLKGDTIFLFGKKVYKIVLNSMKIYNFPNRNDVYSLNVMVYE